MPYGIPSFYMLRDSMLIILVEPANLFSCSQMKVSNIIRIVLFAGPVWMMRILLGFS